MSSRESDNRRFVLGTFNVEDLARSPTRFAGILECFHLRDSFLQHQRAQILPQLSESLLKHCTEFPFDKWQRVVTLKYFSDPLSPLGSVRTPRGGRFNIGSMDPARFRPFPALYVASDRGTSILEKFGVAENDSVGRHSALELALTRPTDIAAFSVSGRLSTVLDIRTSRPLRAFTQLISGFKFPKELLQFFKKHGFQEKLS